MKRKKYENKIRKNTNNKKGEKNEKENFFYNIFCLFYYFFKI